MNPSKFIFSARPGLSVGIVIPAALLAGSAHAQSNLSESPGQFGTSGADRLAAEERANLSLTPGTDAYIAPNSFLRWGPINARPHFDASFSYSTRLRSETGSAEDTVSEAISPGVLFELGPKWRLDYTPTLTYYSSKNFKDNLSHSVHLSGGFTYDSWTFGLSQSYSRSSQSLLETGRQTDQESFVTGLSAFHYLNSKLMLQLGFDQSFRSAENQVSSRSWSTMDWLNYQVASRLSVGAGIGGGYEEVNIGNDMTFEQLQARVDARIAQKLNLSVHGGGELRQILDSGADPLLNPIYGAAIIYHPFTYTTLTLAGNRVISSSLLVGQLTERTDISLSLHQRLFGQVSGSLSGGFQNTRFIISNRTTSLNREDNAVFFTAGLGYTFLKRASAGLYYSYTDNSSSDSLFSIASHRVSLHLGYHF